MQCVSRQSCPKLLKSLGVCLTVHVFQHFSLSIRRSLRTITLKMETSSYDKFPLDKYTLLVSLDGTSDPEVSRTLTCSSSMRFTQLAIAIQLAFGWQKLSPHQFEINRPSLCVSPHVKVPELRLLIQSSQQRVTRPNSGDEEWEGKGYHRLASFFTTKNGSTWKQGYGLSYIYGGSETNLCTWRHTIKLL